MSTGEQRNIDLYEEAWQKKRGVDDPYHKNRVFQTNQNAQEFYTATSKTGQFPCFIRGTSAIKLWNPTRQRWLSSLEKFAQMGFPMHAQIAQHLGVNVLHPADLQHPHQCIGNAMHVANVASVVMAALLSVKLYCPQSLLYIFSCTVLQDQLLMHICAIFSDLSVLQRFKVR